jgi:hypothetical protein
LSAVELNAVRTTQILYIESAALKDNGRVSPRDVAIFDWEVSRFSASTDDVFIFVDGYLLSSKDSE